MLHITRCRGANRRVIRAFLQYDPSLKTIYNLSANALSITFPISYQNALQLKQDLGSKALFDEIKNDLTQFRAITILDKDYPTILKTIQDAPLILYALGNVSLLKHIPALSVIGTRTPSKEAHAKVSYIVKPLIEGGWMTVSGMAKGIDGFVHQLTLEQKGFTIAVLGSGFNHIYPRNHIDLFYQIATKGLLLSEYPPDTPPRKHHFPERNRIISGLSFGTLVIEATERSGTLITVDQALDQGREVYAVPGSIFHKQTTGCHKMIQDGAKLVRTSEDISQDWHNTSIGLFYQTQVND
nr:DNA-processing protein DprA [Lentibacillus sp. JNUCC-1]